MAILYLLLQPKIINDYLWFHGWKDSTHYLFFGVQGSIPGLGGKYFSVLSVQPYFHVKSCSATLLKSSSGGQPPRRSIRLGLTIIMHRCGDAARQTPLVSLALQNQGNLVNMVKHCSNRQAALKTRRRMRSFQMNLLLYDAQTGFEERRENRWIIDNNPPNFNPFLLLLPILGSNKFFLKLRIFLGVSYAGGKHSDNSAVLLYTAAAAYFTMLARSAEICFYPMFLFASPHLWCLSLSLYMRV